MDDIELILTLLGKATTTRFTRERDSKEFRILKKDAKDGGDVAGATRKDIEQKLGKSIITNDNFLAETEEQKHFRLLLTASTAQLLKNCLNLLGIKSLEKM